MNTVTFSYTRCEGSQGVIRLNLAGNLRDTVAEQIRTAIIAAVTVDQPDELLVDLDAVTFLSDTGVTTLMAGYIAAIECGTSYRVVNARDQVRHVLHSAGILDVLADSEDIGSLLLALLTRPVYGGYLNARPLVGLVAGDETAP